MLKTNGGRSLVVGFSLLGVTTAVVAISLLRHVSAMTNSIQFTDSHTQEGELIRSVY